LSNTSSVQSKSPAAGRGFTSPFARLAQVLEGIAPAASAINMSIGEPRHAVPSFVGPIIAAHIDDFGKYPPIKGSDDFRASVAAWLERRFGLAGAVDANSMILPLNGSREGIFYAAIEARMASRKSVADPIILIPNPFYQAYAAGAVGSGCEPYMVNADASTGFLPDIEALPADVLERTVACFFASPANPQGVVASLGGWQTVIRLARQHDFMLLADECYSEIYRSDPPVGALEAAHKLDGTFSHVLSFNSLSKRSNLPGMRVGFVAGDPRFLTRWMTFRNMSAPQVPLPLQAVAAVAYRDEAHVIENRRLYNEKFAIADEILRPMFGDVVPPGGFFLWLDVGRHGGGEAVSLKLWREAGLRVIPGGYLAVDGADGVNPGNDFIRIALVESSELTREALTRLKRVLS
jgi:aspartate/methionine/tyrosine aminotransferase